jgi:hypothetical protein
MLRPQPAKSLGFTDIVATLRPPGGITLGPLTRNRNRNRNPDLNPFLPPALLLNFLAIHLFARIRAPLRFSVDFPAFNGLTV